MDAGQRLDRAPVRELDIQIYYLKESGDSDYEFDWLDKTVA